MTQRSDPLRDPTLAAKLDAAVRVPLLSTDDRDRMVQNVVAAALAKRASQYAAALMYTAAWARVIIPAAAVIVFICVLFLYRNRAIPALAVEDVLGAANPTAVVLIEHDDPAALLCASSLVTDCPDSEVK